MTDLSQFVDMMNTTNLTKKDLDQIYDAFMENMQILINSPHYDIDFLSVKDLPSYNLTDKEWNTMGDKYISDTVSDIKNLGRSIIQNGTYWPVIVMKDEEGQMKLREGQHRISSLNLLIKNGEIEDAYLPVLICYKGSVSPSDKQLHYYYVINPNCMNNAFKDRYSFFYQSITKYEVVNDYLWKVTGSNPYLATMMIVFAVRNVIFDYSAKTGVFYKPRIELNNKFAMKLYFYLDQMNRNT